VGKSSFTRFWGLGASATSLVRRLRSAVTWRVYRPLHLRYARLCRRRLRRVTFIGITGSAGKTSTKDMAVAILRHTGRVTHNAGTANRIFHIGEVIAGTKPDDEYCVLELSAERPGYFDPLLDLVQPKIGVVTAVGDDQLKAFGSRAAIAAEKGKLIAALSPDGTAVLNVDDPLVMAMASQCKGNVITFGLDETPDLRATDIRADWPNRLSFMLSYRDQRYPVQTQLCGKHWVTAILAALAVAAAARIDLAEAARAIAEVPPGRARMQPVTTPDGVTFIRDDWKSALWSLPTVFEFLQEARAERKIVVFGTLADYQGDGRTKYQAAGEHALQVADIVIFAGEMATSGLRAQKFVRKEQRLLAFPDIRQASDELGKILQPGDLVVLKGSAVADHLGRLYHARVEPVACWRMDCGKDLLCDVCSLLRAEDSASRHDLRKTQPGPEKNSLGSEEPDMPAPSMVLVGIGNPGKKYNDTPHNVGFAVLDLLAERYGVVWEGAEDAEIARFEYKGAQILIVKPQKLVNNTGKVLLTLAETLHFSPRDCVLVHDDIRMQLGSVRTRLRGSDGGHLGLRSVIVAFQTSDIPRVKVGVKAEEDVPNQTKYVVSKFSREAAARMDAAYVVATDRVLEIVRREIVEGAAFRDIPARIPEWEEKFRPHRAERE
jgi:aminoacyl-tRNA hydrolase